MKAVRLYEFGGPKKLVYGEHPLPQLGPGDVLVKVLATSVSRWDVKYRTGEVHEFYGKTTGHHGGIHGRRAFPMPMQLGRDAAGEVAEVGANVTALKPGDRVVGMTDPENTRSLTSVRCCRSPRSRTRMRCWRRAGTSSAASCSIPGTALEPSGSALARRPPLI
jgi:putative oxidoreductase